MIGRSLKAKLFPCPLNDMEDQNNSDIMIQATDLTHFYGPQPAIEDVNFGVKRGEILGFLGPNGAGKTTTMRILTGFMPPTEGRVTLADYDVVEQSLESSQAHWIPAGNGAAAHGDAGNQLPEIHGNPAGDARPADKEPCWRRDRCLPFAGLPQDHYRQVVQGVPAAGGNCPGDSARTGSAGAG